MSRDIMDQDRRTGPVEALYANDDLVEAPAMRQLRGEFNRMLGNGWCSGPNEMGCNMPPVEGPSDDEIDLIIVYVREQQETHGLEPYPSE